MRRKLLRLIMLSMFVAIGVVISPILRVEGFAPTAHLVNVVCAVLMGPWYAVGNGLTTAIIRMALMGIPPLALTGQVFGALLAGIFYRASRGKLILATLGEIIGTGVIGSLLSYPIMKFLMGRGELSLFFYMPSFIIASVTGGTIAYILLKTLQKTGVLSGVQIKLGGKPYDK